MPTTTPTNLLDLAATLIFLKVAILIILIFYAIFALMIVRQVSLMATTLITKISPLIKLISVVHAGFALGLIVLVFFLL